MATITIIGVGALGSHVALFLRNVPQELHVVDHDKVEQKNLQAQFHTKLGLRQNKALALQKALDGLFGVKVKATPHRVTSDNVATLLGGSTLVIDCTDNIAARLLIQGYCKPAGIPCLHGCLSADASFARVIWTELFAPDPEGTEGQATCEDGEALSFIGSVGAVIAGTANTFLKGKGKTNWQLTPESFVRLA